MDQRKTSTESGLTVSVRFKRRGLGKLSIFLGLLCTLIACVTNSTAKPQLPALPFRGVDASFATQLVECGSRLAGQSDSYPWHVYRESGINLIRLRVWVDPQDAFNGLADTLIKAKAAHTAGLQVMVDFHYSDTWADPGKQIKPSAWQGADFSTLKQQVYHHTLEVLSALAAEGIDVPIVQLGNEIRPGMLWDEGRVGGEFDNNWGQLTQLLQSAKQGVIDSPISPLVSIHIDSGGDATASRWFFDNLRQNGFEFDVISLSYYPWWHGDLDALQHNLLMLANRYQLPILLAEVAYPYTLDYHDRQPNFVWQPQQLLNNYPASKQGQRRYMARLIQIVSSVPNDLGQGLVYWAPDHIGSRDPKCYSPWDNLTLFDRKGTPLPALRTLGQTAP